jgi:hypothetical protein
MSTRLKLALALALGALFLLPAAAAQAVDPATFTSATLTPSCTLGNGENPCEPGQVYPSRRIEVREFCDRFGVPNAGQAQGELSTPNPPNPLDPNTYQGSVTGSEADGAHVHLTAVIREDPNGFYTFELDLSPNQSFFTGTMEIRDTGATGDTGEYSVTGERSLGPIPGCGKSAPAKKCKKRGKKSEAQSAKKKKCKKKH